MPIKLWVLLLYGQEEVAEIEKETHRLAVVNMDWRYVKVRILSIMWVNCVFFWSGKILFG